MRWTSWWTRRLRWPRMEMMIKAALCIHTRLPDRPPCKLPPIRGGSTSGKGLYFTPFLRSKTIFRSAITRGPSSYKKRTIQGEVNFGELIIKIKHNLKEKITFHCQSILSHFAPFLRHSSSLIILIIFQMRNKNH